MLPQVILNHLGSIGEAASTWFSENKYFGSVGQCPPLPKGDLNYDIYMGYPEMFAWDKKRCVAYVSNLYNATVSTWDPYKSVVLDTIHFPGLSHAGNSASPNPLHASGIILRPDAYHAETLEVVIDNGDAFYSDGFNVSGPDHLMSIDLKTKEVTSQLRLNNGLYAGYADASLGPDGNTYVLGTYSSNILRVTPDKEISTFYVAEPLGPPRLYGFTGIAHVGDAMIVPDNIIGQLIRFDVRDKVGTPVTIKQTPYHEFKTANVLHFPERYNDTILLVAENMTPDYPYGGVSVYQDKTKQFNEVEFLGFLPSRLTNALTTSARQMADRIYVVALPTDGANITVAGESSRFPFQDITEELDLMILPEIKDEARDEI
ncbi:tri14 [Fusarium sporotrichioides]|uniref:Core trichothecene cluster (CTC) protein 14 n=5 Tax=Fusarium sambucinum species complex TaxID=569360 RepID=TRI14_FUSSP|nr:RecName: Full=Core trichothecene cluster (CTC) protein 14 [Fusarium sporotrichioides]AAG46054.1 TRI14 [Fusarium sporotrichioides]AAK77936.1 TRI14 [Fusarium sporotrichioides]AAN40835.1 unknown [Fusarium sporotrichioides]RGP67094.1 tri14 [Fusarium sporotrichioides]